MERPFGKMFMESHQCSHVSGPTDLVTFSEVGVDNGYGLGAGKRSAQERKSLLSWAKQCVSEVTGRTKTVVGNVYTVSKDKMRFSNTQWKSVTEGEESWTSIINGATVLDNTVSDGFSGLCWRRTEDTDTDEVIESRPISDVGISFGYLIRASHLMM